MRDLNDKSRQRKGAKELLREALTDSDYGSKADSDGDRSPVDTSPSRRELLLEFAEHLEQKVGEYDGQDRKSLSSVLQMVTAQIGKTETISSKVNSESSTIKPRRRGVHYWTNSSVKALAGPNAKGELPIQLITDKARNLILEYVQDGGAAEPVDPFDLARYKNLKVEACENVQDARTIQRDDGGYLIQYNPHRPDVRVRFSLCHEITHTMFPDCSARVRNRGTHEGMVRDEWQLESLCDIGAAELLMPIGSFKELEKETMSIDLLLKAKDRLRVSTEALLLRAVKLTHTQCFVFSASRSDHGPARYKIDYAYGSKFFRTAIPQLKLPSDSVISNCLKFGHTDNGHEIWSPSLGVLRVECVAVSPYPNRVLPRVMGIAVPVQHENVNVNSIKYVKGDAIQPSHGGHRIVAQVVNDKTPMWGGGFALAVRKRLPDVQKDFHSWVITEPGRLALGNSHLSIVDDRTDVFNMICQSGYKQTSKPTIRYSALRKCLARLSVLAKERGATVHMPRIGCGQARGNWHIVSELITELLCEEGINVTVYDLPGTEFVQKQPALF